jgi:hypothetical protein
VREREKNGIQPGAPMEEFRLLRGFEQVTMGKNSFSCEYRSCTSLPLKI